jgi:hypothetical protein
VNFRQRAATAFRRGENDDVERMSRHELSRARQAADAPAETEALCMLSRVAIRSGNLAHAQRLASEALEVAVGEDDKELEVSPRHILAAAARMSGDLALARDLYLDSIALNQFLGRAAAVNAEYHNLAFTELHLGNTERARELFDTGRERVFSQGYDDFVPYVCVAAAVMAGVAEDHVRAAQLLGMTATAFEAVNQVPDPDDAAELEAIRVISRKALGEPAFEVEYERGTKHDPRPTLRQSGQP